MSLLELLEKLVDAFPDNEIIMISRPSAREPNKFQFEIDGTPLLFKAEVSDQGIVVTRGGNLFRIIAQ